MKQFLIHELQLVELEKISRRRFLMKIIMTADDFGSLQDIIKTTLSQELDQRGLSPNTTSPFLNKKQACDYLGIVNNTLDNWIEKGLPIIRIGKTVRFNRFHINEWMTKLENSP